jgi:hypothetical protein
MTDAQDDVPLARSSAGAASMPRPIRQLCAHVVGANNDRLRQLFRMRSQCHSNHGSAAKYHIDADDQS